MTLRFSLREHKYTAWTPNIVFSKSAESKIRIASDDINSRKGDGYCFVVVPRSWLHGKYIRWTWTGWINREKEGFYVRIYDGEYDRSSDTDFPEESSLLIKGNGLLQSFSEGVLLGDMIGVNREIQADVDGGSEDKCTIFFKLYDHWDNTKIRVDISFVEINTESGGGGNLYSEGFDAEVVMERTETTKDYGYISSGIVSMAPTVTTQDATDIGFD